MLRSTEAPLRIEPCLSLRLGLLVVVSHVLATMVVAVLPLVVPLRLALGLFVASSLVYSIKTRVLRKGDSAIKAVKLDPVTGWSLYTARGVIEQVSLHPSSFIRPWLMVLNFSVGRFDSRSLILFPDALDGETLRRLRVQLRIRPTC